MKVRQVSLADVLPLRSSILRPGQPLEAICYPGDSQAVHFGMEIEGEIVSVVTAHPEPLPLKPCKNPWRIRGVATVEKFQGKGYGSQVITALLAWAFDEGVDLLWCNARERAIPFYERHGFETVSGLFEIPKVGPHKVMVKLLN